MVCQAGRGLDGLQEDYLLCSGKVCHDGEKNSLDCLNMMPLWGPCLGRPNVTCRF